MNLTEKIGKLLKFLKKNQCLILILILLLATGIRLYYFSQTFNQPLWWDEADYMSYAKRIGKNLDINNIWYYRRTFFLPLFWGSLFKFGFGEASIRFTEILFSLGVVFFSYLIGKEMFNKTVGLITATGMAFSRLTIFLGTRFLTSIPATFFFLVGLWLFWKGYVKKQNNKFIWLAGLFAGLAIFTRFALLLSLIPLGIYVLFNEKGRFWKNKHIWIGALIILLILTPYFIGYSQHVEGGITGFVKHYLATGAEESGGSGVMGFKGIWEYIKSIDLNIGMVFSIFLIIGCSLFLNLLYIDKIFGSKQVQKALFFLIWILVPLLFHGMYSVYAEARYLLWAYPAVFMLAGSGMVKSYHYLKKYSKFIAPAILGLLIVLVLINSYSQIKMGDELIKNKINSYEQVKDAGLWMKENSKSGDIIISNSIPQIQYYSERSTYMPNNVSHLESLGPKFVMVSIYEGYKEWFFKYPEERGLKVVQAYTLDGKSPSVIIYESY